MRHSEDGRRMVNKKKDPYEYITPDNFDMVRQCLMQGLHSKDPKLIVKNMKKVTDIPEDAIEAIVSQEVGGAFDAWQEQNG
jgi:hypothetical protein